MDKKAILDFAKKNTLILILSAVGLAGMVAAYYPLGGMNDQLRTDAETEAGKFQPLKGLSRARVMPQYDVESPEPVPLVGFPTKAVVDAGTASKAKLEDQSKKVLASVETMNAEPHVLLVTGSLPKAPGQQVAINFASRYVQVFGPTDPTVSGDANAAAPLVPNPILTDTKIGPVALNIVNDVLHGGLPPTAKEQADAADRLHAEVYVPRIIYQGTTAINQAAVEADFNAEKRLLPDRMKKAVATSKKIYVEHDALTPMADINPSQAPLPRSIWFAQLSLWMQQDIAAALVEANTDSKNILDAKVKRLLAFQVRPDPMYLFPSPAAGAATPTAGASPMTETGVLPKAYDVSPTGRASNGMYDVVPFRLLIDVDANQVPAVLRAISHNRLMYITNQNMYVVNNAKEAAVGGYLYGDVPVVRLSLEGEELFMRSWTLKLMPDDVKMTLGLTAPGAAGVPAVPAAAGFPGGGGMMPQGGGFSR